MMPCLLKALYQKHRIQEMSPKGMWLIEKRYITCISQLLGSSTMSKLAHFGSIAPYFLIYPESDQDGAKLTRFVEILTSPKVYH